MTASAMSSNLGILVDQLALDDRIREKANGTIDRMLAEIDGFRMHQAGSEAAQAEHRLDQVIKSANDSLEDILTAFQELIADIDATLDRVDEGINAVRIGDEKWAGKEPVELLLRLSMGLSEQMALTFRLAERHMEGVAPNRMSVAQGIALLRELEADCAILHGKLDELSEKVHVRDAMTEKPLSRSGISELDALNEP